jgi:1-deoxy-D-xylulose-5-phosphate reductoisomerase
MLKRLAILGSTGSIGTQTLDVVSQYPDRFSVEALAAGNNLKLLIAQARKFKPSVVSVANPAHYEELKRSLADMQVTVIAGPDAAEQLATMDNIDIVVAAMVGFAGLKPTAAAVSAGKEVALANKETLVIAGEMIMRVASEKGIRILPVDSEHSAILQCITGEEHKSIEKLILTASGGPFRSMSAEYLQKVTPAEALKHPNWSMGNKITIDSATLMNKGLEVIEAHWLFDIPSEKIDILVHPQSLIHSMVQFTDGSVKAQLSVPDMRLPIRYALSFPERMESNMQRISLAETQSLTFEKPDTTRFRNLLLAREALIKGGNMPCALNAANEVAVKAFLEGRTDFFGMSRIVEYVLEKTYFNKEASLSVYEETDTRGRYLASEFLEKSNRK